MSVIGFIGLGVMGASMAGHLAEAGHDLCVFNRTTAKSQQWQLKYSGRMALTPAQAAQGADWVFTCVGNDDDLREVILGGKGALAAMKPGSVLVDHTTASKDIAEEISEIAAQRGVHFLDAPVSGGQKGAEEGLLTVMVGGPEEVFNEAKTIIQAYAKTCRLMGAVGAGQLTKMVNQICVGGVLQGLAEALHFAQCAGLDAEAAMSVISQGAAASWQLDNRHKSMLAGQFDFGFAVDWMRKDFALVLQEARANGAQLPVTALVDQFYADIQKVGGGRWDTSSLITRLK